MFALVARLKILGCNEKKLRFTQSFHGDGDGARSDLESRGDFFLLRFFLRNFPFLVSTGWKVTTHFHIRAMSTSISSDGPTLIFEAH